METAIYKLSYNFSNAVYIGQSTNMDARAYAHRQKMARLSALIKTENRAYQDICNDSPASSVYQTQNGYPLQMYADALAHFSKYGDLPEISKIDIVDLVKCDCKTHRGRPCTKAIRAEAKVLAMFTSNYNQQKHLALTNEADRADKIKPTPYAKIFSTSAR